MKTIPVSIGSTLLGGYTGTHLLSLALCVIAMILSIFEKDTCIGRTGEDITQTENR